MTQTVQTPQFILTTLRRFLTMDKTSAQQYWDGWLCNRSQWKIYVELLLTHFYATVNCVCVTRETLHCTKIFSKIQFSLEISWILQLTEIMANFIEMFRIDAVSKWHSRDIQKTHFDFWKASQTHFNEFQLTKFAFLTAWKKVIERA